MRNNGDTHALHLHTHCTLRKNGFISVIMAFTLPCVSSIRYTSVGLWFCISKYYYHLISKTLSHSRYKNFTQVVLTKFILFSLQLNFLTILFATRITFNFIQILTWSCYPFIPFSCLWAVNHTAMTSGLHIFWPLKKLSGLMISVVSNSIVPARVDPLDSSVLNARCASKIIAAAESDRRAGSATRRVGFLT